MKSAIYQILARTMSGYQNCSNIDWQERHKDRLEYMAKNYLPSGCGFDCGTLFDLDRSHPDKLVFTTSFHHMNEDGYYDGWTKHDVVVTPSLVFGFYIRVTGKNRGGIKDYIADVFSAALQADYETDTAFYGEA